MLNIKDIQSCDDVNSALAYLSTHPAAKPLAAGTDIIPAVRDHLISDVELLDLHKLEDLDYIKYENHSIKIGAMTTHDTISNAPLIKQYIPALSHACGQIGSAQIRRRATIGGNICHASPAADSVPVLVAAGSSVTYRTVNESKTLLLEEFLVGPRRTQLPAGALLKEISIPIPEGGWIGDYYKVGGRTALTIAITSVAVLYGFGEWRVAYGSMSAHVERTRNVEEHLTQNNVTKESIRETVDKNLSPISDIRASAQYRSIAAGNLTWLGWHKIYEKGLTTQ